MRKKNKKGFTLVELLAVIVILAIILVIAVPKISNVIESSKKSTFEETALNIVKAANYYYATSLLETSEQGLITFTVNNDKLMSGDNELAISGKAPVGDSWVKINEVGNVALRITDGVYYASKDFDETGVIVTEDEEAALTREELAQKVAALEIAMTNLTNKESEENIFLKTYPIGSVYTSVTNTNPGEIYGGTWVSFGSGKTIVGVDSNDTDFNTVEKTGGEKMHTLTVEEMPSHRHGFRYSQDNGTSWHPIDYFGRDGDISGYGHIFGLSNSIRSYSESMVVIDYTGSSQAHNNIQPYITVYMWKRTA